MTPSPTPDVITSTGPTLRRALTLWDLILYGVVVISPVGPMAFFGVLSQRGQGHAPTAILIAMVAMMLTAVSYGRMARVYPSAGSAFTYVGKEISPALGYITGWGMLMDYTVSPLICIIWCSKQGHAFLPEVPYWALAMFFTIVSTGLNVQGIKSSARVNAVLATGMGIVVVIFLVAATFYIFNHPHTASNFFIRPFYDPQKWTGTSILGASSIAVLAYIGFDGISTLSEEAKKPRRDILLATVLTCLAIGIVSVLEVYTAQLVWPISERYPDVDTAFTFVAQRAWEPLFRIVGLTMMVAAIGSGMAAQLGAARLFYGMGRSGALPRSFFGSLDPKRQVPRNNVIFVGAVAFVGALVLPLVAGQATGYELGAGLLNCGALIAFMGVNAAAFVHYYLRAERKKIVNLAPPILGFLVCLLLWCSLSREARIFGSIWMVIGIALGAWRTHGFRGTLLDFELPVEARACPLATATVTRIPPP